MKVHSLNDICRKCVLQVTMETIGTKIVISEHLMPQHGRIRGPFLCRGTWKNGLDGIEAPQETVLVLLCVLIAFFFCRLLFIFCS